MFNQTKFDELILLIIIWKTRAAERDEEYTLSRQSLLVLWLIFSDLFLTSFCFLWTNFLSDALRLYSFHLCCFTCRYLCFRLRTFNLIQFLVWLFISLLVCAYRHVGKGTLNTFRNALRRRSYSWNHALARFLFFSAFIWIFVFCPLFLQLSLF